MNSMIKVLAFLMCFALSGFSQIIDNVQFTDMEGESYDLHEILESGKYVLVHFSFVN